ncbi:MAG: CRISPR system precrRNA processing endoribonuclease RAMP protein Cas6 [Promethearchaeota archaeon]
MSFIGSVRPDMANYIYTEKGIPLYTSQVEIDEPSIIFRYNLFSRELGMAFKDFILDNDNNFYKLGFINAFLTQVKPIKINIGKFIDNSSPINWFKIIFLKPTYFKKTYFHKEFSSHNRDIKAKAVDFSSQKSVAFSKHVLFPDPELIFNNLVNNWDLYTGSLYRIPKTEFINWVNKNIFITSHEIKTDCVEIHKNKPTITGFTGWANFKIKGNNADFKQIVSFLLDFAKFSNIGGNRAIGMGRVKVKKRKLKNADNQAR